MNLATHTEPLRERIDAAIDDFDGRHSGWDLRITRLTIAPSSHHAGRAGLSCFVHTVDMGFEVPLEPSDDVAATLGEPVH